MITASAAYNNQGDSPARCACCAKVADSTHGRICMAVACSDMDGSTVEGLASATCVVRLARWFDEKLPYVLQQSTDDTRILLNHIKQACETLLTRINNLIYEHTRARGISAMVTLNLVISVDDHYLGAIVGLNKTYMVNPEQGIGLVSPYHDVPAKSSDVMRYLGENDFSSPIFHEGRISEGEAVLVFADTSSTSLRNVPAVSLNNILSEQQFDDMAKMLLGLSSSNESCVAGITMCPAGSLRIHSNAG